MRETWRCSRSQFESKSIRNIKTLKVWHKFSTLFKLNSNQMESNRNLSCSPEPILLNSSIWIKTTRCLFSVYFVYCVCVVEIHKITNLKFCIFEAVAGADATTTWKHVPQYVQNRWIKPHWMPCVSRQQCKCCTILELFRFEYWRIYIQYVLIQSRYDKFKSAPNEPNMNVEQFSEIYRHISFARMFQYLITMEHERKRMSVYMYSENFHFCGLSTRSIPIIGHWNKLNSCWNE